MKIPRPRANVMVNKYSNLIINIIVIITITILYCWYSPTSSSEKWAKKKFA